MDNFLGLLKHQTTFVLCFSIPAFEHKVGARVLLKHISMLMHKAPIQTIKGACSFGCHFLHVIVTTGAIVTHF